MKSTRMKKAAATLAMVVVLTTGCGAANDNVQTTAVETQTMAETKESAKESANVAKGSETAEALDIVDEDAVPIYGNSLVDGVYSITVDSSSKMFNIEQCELTVKDGQMTAKMTMGGTGYLKVFMGKGVDADTADESAMIPFEELESGEHTFTVPVEALDQGIDCAAFSKKKEKWYDRTIVFRAATLPAEAFKDGVLVTAKSLNLEDGEYTAVVEKKGGSGRSSIQSPAKIKVQDGKMTAVIVWSSENYDYMIVNGERYDVLTTEGGSTFEIPMTAFDMAIPIIGDTVAMNEPHEIQYTFKFDSSTVVQAE